MRIKIPKMTQCNDILGAKTDKHVLFDLETAFLPKPNHDLIHL